MFLESYRTADDLGIDRTHMILNQLKFPLYPIMRSNIEPEHFIPTLIFIYHIYKLTVYLEIITMCMKMQFSVI